MTFCPLWREGIEDKKATAGWIDCLKQERFHSDVCVSVPLVSFNPGEQEVRNKAETDALFDLIADWTSEHENSAALQLAG